MRIANDICLIYSITPVISRRTKNDKYQYAVLKHEGESDKL